MIETVVWRCQVQRTYSGYYAELRRDGLEHEPLEYEVRPRTDPPNPARLFARIHISEIIRSRQNHVRIREFQRGLRRKT